MGFRLRALRFREVGVTGFRFIGHRGPGKIVSRLQHVTVGVVKYSKSDSKCDILLYT